jgi:hypothetical protein
MSPLQGLKVVFFAPYHGFHPSDDGFHPRLFTFDAFGIIAEKTVSTVN